MKPALGSFGDARSRRSRDELTTCLLSPPRSRGRAGVGCHFCTSDRACVCVVRSSWIYSNSKFGNSSFCQREEYTQLADGTAIWTFTESRLCGALWLSPWRPILCHRLSSKPQHRHQMERLLTQMYQIVGFREQPFSNIARPTRWVESVAWLCSCAFSRSNCRCRRRRCDIEMRILRLLHQALLRTGLGLQERAGQTRSRRRNMETSDCINSRFSKSKCSFIGSVLPVLLSISSPTCHAVHLSLRLSNGQIAAVCLTGHIAGA